MDSQQGWASRFEPGDDFLGREVPKVVGRGLCSLVIFECVSWKEVGDEYGHRAAESVLDWVSEAIASLAPSTAALGRLKLTTFAMLVPTEGTAAAKLAREIVDLVRGKPVPIATNRTVRVDIVAGLADTTEAAGHSAAGLTFEALWRTMYVAPYTDGGVGHVG